jgi:hypothetical protein
MPQHAEKPLHSETSFGFVAADGHPMPTTRCSNAIPAAAGGGVNWQVKVKNPTQWECSVRVNTVSIESYRWLTIDPGGSKTADTGALCPGGLGGYCVISFFPYKTFILQQTDMQGTPMSSAWGGAACWNHSMKICKKKGDDANPQDGDYSFCKD